jgi:uncharacterized membrane protein (UPF0127 family)
MTSTTNWPAVVLLLVLGASACSQATPASTSSEADIEVGGEPLTVWVADEPIERQQGLMGVDRLPLGIDGMLFVYESERSTTFSMFNTPMTLDIWWFDSDGVLVGSAEMEPCFAKPCTSYRSPGPIESVLETPQDRYDFRPGIGLSTIDSS